MDFVLKGPEDTSNIPLVSIGKLFVEAFKTFDNNIKAVIDAASGKTLTYRQLYQLSQNLAKSLKLMGVSTSHKIGLVAENSPEFLVVYLAVFFVGASLHLINPKYTKIELKHVLQLSQPVLVFCTSKTQNIVKPITEELKFIEMVLCFDAESALSQINSRTNDDSVQIEESIDPKEQVALICDSSEDAELPKGVMITHENLRLHFVYARDSDFLATQPGKTHPLVAPFFHIYGVHAINAALSCGATIVTIDSLKPEDFLEAIQKFKPEQLYLDPSLLKSQEIRKYNLSSVNEVFAKVSFLTIEDSKMLQGLFKLKKLHVGYATPETGIVAHAVNHDKGGVGKLTCGHHLKITDLKNASNLPAFKKGEICIKGSIMKGYINNLQETNKVIDTEGFFHTGDVGYYDSDGDLFVLGRIKNIIKYSSSEVYPEELEGILMKHSDIKDVAVVGKPDRQFGEIPTAFVVREPGVTLTEEEICNFLTRFVTDERLLRGSVKFVDGLPRNSSGNILRRELVETLSG